jgi:hypothetical protein
VPVHVPLLLAAALVAQAAVSADDPEPTIRAFYRALYLHDRDAFRHIVVADPRADRFIGGDAPSAEQALEIEEDAKAFNLRVSTPFQWHGAPAVPGADGRYPVGTTARYLGSFKQSLAIVTVVRQQEGWKVDLRWWHALADVGERPPEPGTPEHAIKGLTLALVTLDREEAANYIAPGGTIEQLFAEAPRTREPSGQLMALAMEMPLVEVGPGEFFEMPSGTVLEGKKDADTKLLVGLYGPVEIPYVVRRINGDWRVVVEPYFRLIEW